MAAELTPRLQGANPVVLAVMHGGAYAALELCKRFHFPHEFDYVHVTRYRGATRGGLPTSKRRETSVRGERRLV